MTGPSRVPPRVFSESVVAAAAAAVVVARAEEAGWRTALWLLVAAAAAAAALTRRKAPKRGVGEGAVVLSLRENPRRSHVRQWNETRTEPLFAVPTPREAIHHALLVLYGLTDDVLFLNWPGKPV